MNKYWKLETFLFHNYFVTVQKTKKQKNKTKNPKKTKQFLWLDLFRECGWIRIIPLSALSEKENVKDYLLEKVTVDSIWKVHLFFFYNTAI